MSTALRERPRGSDPQLASPTVALARAQRARSKMRLWALSLAGLLALFVSTGLTLSSHNRQLHHREMLRTAAHHSRFHPGGSTPRHHGHDAVSLRGGVGPLPSLHSCRWFLGFARAALADLHLEVYRRETERRDGDRQAAARSGHGPHGRTHSHGQGPPEVVVAEFATLAELQMVPAAEAVATLTAMEVAARAAHDAAGKAKRSERAKAKAAGGGTHATHAPKHAHRVEGKASGEKEPDVSYYTKYLHETLERKPAYPILKGLMHKVIERFPDAQTWLDGGAGTCGVMEALLQLGRKVRTRVLRELPAAALLFACPPASL